MKMSVELIRLKGDAARYEQAMRAIDGVAQLLLSNS
jgi:hypothetical protein